MTGTGGLLAFLQTSTSLFIGKVHRSLDDSVFVITKCPRFYHSQLPNCIGFLALLSFSRCVIFLSSHEDLPEKEICKTHLLRYGLYRDGNVERRRHYVNHDDDARGKHVKYARTRLRAKTKRPFPRLFTHKARCESLSEFTKRTRVFLTVRERVC